MIAIEEAGPDREEARIHPPEIQNSALSVLCVTNAQLAYTSGEYIGGEKMTISGAFNEHNDPATKDCQLNNSVLTDANSHAVFYHVSSFHYRWRDVDMRVDPSPSFPSSLQVVSNIKVVPHVLRLGNSTLSCSNN